MKTTGLEYVVYINCFGFVFVLTFKTIYVHNMFWGCSLYWTGNSMNNLLSYFGLIDARISASDNDFPVNKKIQEISCKNVGL